MVCFDTSFLIDLMNEKRKGKRGPATLKLQELIERNEVPKTTIITLSELYVGPSNVTDPETEFHKIENIVSQMEILDLTQGSAMIFGKLVTQLHKKGTPIGALDTFIAAIVLENKEVLVTFNKTDFEKVAGLKVEGY